MDLPQKMEKNHGFATKNGEQPWIYQKKWRFPKMGVPQFAVSITKGSRGLTSCLASNGIRGCGILSVPTTIGWWLPPIDGLFRDGLPRQKWYILYILYIYIYMHIHYFHDMISYMVSDTCILSINAIWHLSYPLRRYLYIFGGFDGSSCFDDLYVLDLETRRSQGMGTREPPRYIVN